MPPVRRRDALRVEIKPCSVRRDESLDRSLPFILELFPVLTVADAIYQRYDARGHVLIPSNRNAILAVQARVEILARIASSVSVETFLKSIVLGVHRGVQMARVTLVLMSDSEASMAISTAFMAVDVSPPCSHGGVAASNASRGQPKATEKALQRKRRLLKVSVVFAWPRCGMLEFTSWLRPRDSTHLANNGMNWLKDHGTARFGSPREALLEGDPSDESEPELLVSRGDR